MSANAGATGFGPNPWQQTSWDWRAAGNFIGGGAGCGLLLFATLADAQGVLRQGLLVLALLLVSLGLLCVWAEIGRPWRALNVLFHPRTSWMTREALLARRLESELTKEQILYLYLNNVYLGHHSYGVQSAAENYFRKDVKDLSLAEMALLAGLPQAPSAFSPFTQPEKARKRRQYVLGQMIQKGMITKVEFDEASKAEVSVFDVEDVFHEFAPYFTEEVRRDVVPCGHEVALVVPAR